MSGSEDERFEKADAGSSLCEKIESNRLKPGSLVIMKDCPCRISDVTTAKPGKHGSAKVICKGKDILTGKVYECTFHAGDMIYALIVNRKEFTLLNINEKVLELFGRRTLEGYFKENQRYFRRWKERVFGYSSQDYGTRASR